MALPPLLNIAVHAARRAGDLIVRHLDRLDSLNVEAKGRNDFVSEVDRLAEQDIIETIRRNHPDHAILAEESGRQDTDSDYVWIIDPLDGTTNFLHGFPVFSVSIALKLRGRLEHGVIYDPLRQELFTASRGGGAQLDGRRIRVGSRRALHGSLIGTGFPFRGVEHLDGYFRMLNTIVRETAGARRAGSAALDLAYVAAGRLDGFFELDLKEWDVAAGTLLIQEAGGLVGAPDGGAEVTSQGDIMAANPRLFKMMAQALRADYREIRGSGLGVRGSG
ncbi:MAG TPA: inositol monophosphatase family protein [Gammaproteobacteria bacterium]|nr:inositol monophosphatase family protein [Gammaproteobacteria bacterium]